MSWMRQVILRSGATLTVVWLDDIVGLKEHNFCTLKDDPREWEIVKVYDVSMEKKDINRTWHVGGL